MNRRAFLTDFSCLALAAMLHRDGFAAGPHALPDGKPLFAPKAKSVIWLFMIGGVAHMESFDPKPLAPVELRAGLIVGFLGGLTTFSSFSLDTVRLMESGQVPLALGYTSISVVGGLLATWAGLSLTRF